MVRACLFLVAAIAIAGGSLQMYLGQPQTAPRLDNVHRFMAGVYLATGFLNLWAAITIRQQGTLVYLLALGVLLAGAIARLEQHPDDSPGGALLARCRSLAERPPPPHWDGVHVAATK